MKLRSLLAAGAIALMAFAQGLAPAFAQGANVPRVANNRLFGNAFTTSTATNATTTPASVVSVVNNTVYDPGILTSQNASTYITERLKVWWTADVSKATATTGSCEVYLNGTAITRSLRTIGYAGGEGTIGGYVDLAYPTDPFNVGVPNETQTVAVYCFSADTNTFSVYRTALFVEEVF